MALVTTATFTPTQSGAAVALHGCNGLVHPSVTVVEGFRRPGAVGRNFQTVGGEAPPSRLDVWHGEATEAAIAAKRAALCGLAGKLCTLARTNMTTVSVVVTGVEITATRRTAGSALWRLEATLTVEAV